MPIHHQLFPNLGPNSYKITSPASSGYNCIAWAAGVANEWWDPADGYPWPAGLPRDVHTTTLIRLFERLSFVRCAEGDLVTGFEKVVIYGSDVEWEHAARQLPNGRWTSKMGLDEDIEHETPANLAGGAFGAIVCFMERPISTP
jgi:hypothetical protein